jgi:ActR/RegA family two-component response regulator
MTRVRSPALCQTLPSFARDISLILAYICYSFATFSGMQGAAMQFLVVKDYAELAALLHKGSSAASFAAGCAGTAPDARAALTTTRYAAIVPDLGLLDEDGLVLRRELRARTDASPVLGLTQKKSGPSR